MPEIAPLHVEFKALEDAIGDLFYHVDMLEYVEGVTDSPEILKPLHARIELARSEFIEFLTSSG